MKKFIILSLSCFIILAFGAIGYSQEKPPALEFKASGFIDTISQWSRNVVPNSADNVTYGPNTDYTPSGGAFDKKEGLMQTRMRLKFDAIMGPETKGTIQFEGDSSKWGERAPAGAQRNYMGHWNADRAALEIKHAYMAFGLPFIPVPATVQIGIQGNAIRPGIFMSSDGPGIVGALKVDPATIKFLWAKPLENRTYASDDMDAYGVEVNAKIEDVTIGGYGSFWNCLTYPIQDDTSSVAYTAKFWWFGLYADGKVAPVDVNFDLMFDNGKVKDNLGLNYPDVKYSGWITRLKVNYPWEQFNFGVLGMYASGSDTRKTSGTGRPGTLTSAGVNSTKVKANVVPPGSELGYSDSLIFYSSPANRGNTNYWSSPASQVSRGPYGGTWFAKFYGNYKATPWYKVNLEALYIGDTTKNGNTIGTAVKADGTPRDDTSIGWEFNLINEIQIYRNLVWNVGLGMLLAGDALEYVESGTTNKSPKNPWIVGTGITYSF